MAVLWYASRQRIMSVWNCVCARACSFPFLFHLSFGCALARLAWVCWTLNWSCYALWLLLSVFFIRSLWFWGELYTFGSQCYKIAMVLKWNGGDDDDNDNDSSNNDDYDVEAARYNGFLLCVFMCYIILVLRQITFLLPDSQCVDSWWLGWCSLSIFLILPSVGPRLALIAHVLLQSIPNKFNTHIVCGS